MDVYAHPCGTPGCALGHYAAREDLQSDFRIGNDVLADLFNTIVSRRTGKALTLTSREVCEHFGIDHYQARMLFGPPLPPYGRQTDDRVAHHATTPTEAAEWIERFIANGGAL